MPTLAEVGALDRAAFVALLGPAFEAAPWVAEDVFERRPYVSLDDLDAKLRATVAAAPADRRLALVRAHPDLAGRAAIAGDLGSHSTREQAAAGLDRLTPAEYERFQELNAAYRERFGFPFVICAREHDKDSILAAFEQRLAADPADELDTALDQVVRIARLRIGDALA
jgi:OHCU decarboxylase